MNPSSDIIEIDKTLIKSLHVSRITDIVEKPENIEKVLMLYTALCEKMFQDLHYKNLHYFSAGPNKQSKFFVVKKIFYPHDIKYTITKYYKIFLKLIPYRVVQTKNNINCDLFNLIVNLELTYGLIWLIINKKYKLTRFDMKLLNGRYNLYNVKCVSFTNHCGEII